MKKFLAILLAVLCLFAAVSCADGPEPVVPDKATIRSSNGYIYVDFLEPQAVKPVINGSDIMVPKYAYAKIDGLMIDDQTVDGLLPVIQLLLDSQMFTLSLDPTEPDVDLLLDGGLGLKLVAVDDTNTCFRLDFVASVGLDYSEELNCPEDPDYSYSNELNRVYDISLPIDVNTIGMIKSLLNGFAEAEVYLLPQLDTVEVYSVTGECLNSMTFKQVDVSEIDIVEGTEDYVGYLFLDNLDEKVKYYYLDMAAVMTPLTEWFGYYMDALQEEEPEDEFSFFMDVGLPELLKVLPISLIELTVLPRVDETTPIPYSEGGTIIAIKDGYFGSILPITY